MDNFLFSVTVYRDGTLRVNGHGRREALPEILRMIAEALEDGRIVFDGDDDLQVTGADAE